MDSPFLFLACGLPAGRWIAAYHFGMYLPVVRGEEKLARNQGLLA